MVSRELKKNVLEKTGEWDLFTSKEPMQFHKDAPNFPMKAFKDFENPHYEKLCRKWDFHISG